MPSRLGVGHKSLLVLVVRSRRFVRLALLFLEMQHNLSYSDSFFAKHNKCIGAEGADGYIRHCHEDFTGSILAGIIPGGENLNGLDDLREMLGSMGDHMEFRKFEPKDWAAVGNTVYFTVDWELKLKNSENWVECSANVRKVVKDGKTCEKYHLVDSTRIKQLS